jgi:hypothetical protein
VASVLITLIAYLGMALFEYLKEGERVAQREIKTIEVETIAQVDILNAKTKLVRAETRKAKVSSKQPVVFTEQTEQNEQPEQLNSAALALVCEHLSQHPNASARDLLRIPNIPFSSPATASKYKKAAEEMLK